MEWIKCSDRLPDTGKDILVTVKYELEFVEKACMSQALGYSEWIFPENWDLLKSNIDKLEKITDVKFRHVTHWMYLPKPAKDKHEIHDEHEVDDEYGMD